MAYIELTKDNERIVLNVAFDYGGRQEILRAIQHIIRDGVSAEDVDEDLLSRYMYTAGQPDPDLIIRTSGELRISNFLLWQSAYSEYEFVYTLCPDFTAAEFSRVVDRYSARDRRFGAVKV